MYCPKCTKFLHMKKIKINLKQKYNFDYLNYQKSLNSPFNYFINCILS